MLSRFTIEPFVTGINNKNKSLAKHKAHNIVKTNKKLKKLKHKISYGKILYFSAKDVRVYFARQLKSCFCDSGYSGLSWWFNYIQEDDFEKEEHSCLCRTFAGTDNTKASHRKRHAVRMLSTHLGFPRRAAWWRALNPVLLVRVMSAPWSNNRANMSSRFLEIASWSGVSPSASCEPRKQTILYIRVYIFFHSPHFHVSFLFLFSNLDIFHLFTEVLIPDSFLYIS